MEERLYQAALFNPGCLFLTQARPWLERTVPKNFQDIYSCEDRDEPKTVYGTDSYCIVLYLTIKLLQLVVLLHNITITKEAQHRHYTELL